MREWRLIRKTALQSGAEPKTVADVLLLFEEEQTTPEDERMKAELLIMQGMMKNG